MTNSISVIIPTYNGVRFIQEAIDSVLAQTLPPKEIIVVDDASTDGTADLVEALIPRSSVPIRVIRRPCNSGGPAMPINIGIEAAQGEFIAVLDQDDTFAPAKLSEQIPPLASHPDLSFVFSYCGHHGEPEQILQSKQALRAIEQCGSDVGDCIRIPGRTALGLFMRHENYVMGWPGFVFRRRDWRQLGGLNMELRIAADYDFLCRLSLRGGMGLIPRILYYRRLHEGNLTNRWTIRLPEAIRIRACHLAREHWLLKEHGLIEYLRGQFFDWAYTLREAGYYREAIRCLFLYRRFCGWDRRVLSSLLKLPPHWLYARLVRSARHHSDVSLFPDA